jgi:AcrR family transcriptional regulator
MDVPRTVERTAALNQDDWTRAALAAIADRGVANVSVERLAKDLGATKGSFYWHFTDRAALVGAALERWERVFTDRILDELGVIADPSARFRALLGTIFQESVGASVDVALLADAHDQLVQPVLERVARKRLAFLEQIFTDLGRKHPRDRALLATTAYIGLAQLRRSAPGLTPSARRVRTYVDHVVETLLAD